MNATTLWRRLIYRCPYCGHHVRPRAELSMTIHLLGCRTFLFGQGVGE